MPKTKRKSDRLEARVTEEQKQLISLAAHYEGLTVTDYAVRHLLRVSQEVVEQGRRFELAQKEQELFAQALLKPPPPNASLRAAWSDYVKLVDEL